MIGGSNVKADREEGLSGKPTITRAEIMDSLVHEVGLTRQDCGELLEQTLEMIAEALERGETVTLAKFGNFVVREKNARTGRNPKTGKEAEISARRVVAFRPSPLLKQRVDEALTEDK